MKVKEEILNRSLGDSLSKINTNIFMAEQSFVLLCALCEINISSLDPAFKPFFYTVTEFSRDNCFLYISKIYEKPNNNYPNISIKTLLIDLKFVDLKDREEKGSQLNKSTICEFLKKKNYNISSNDSRECLNTIIDYFSNELNTLEDKKVLEPFLAMRDKQVAHTENCILTNEIGHGFTYEQFKESFKLLLEFAKEFYNVITIFFGLRYAVTIGEFSNYDISASLSLQKIIEKISNKYREVLGSIGISEQFWPEFIRF